MADEPPTGRGGGDPDEELKAMQEILDGIRFIQRGLSMVELDRENPEKKMRLEKWAQEKVHEEIPELFYDWESKGT